jgi:wyosine [tRNA(Phe)-imidazoG37] synthetase (radical SAM superfamily)
LPGEVSRIAAFAQAVRPDRVQLNTAVRPPAEEYAYALPRGKMEELAQLFDPPAEVIAEFSPDGSGTTATTEETVLALLRRRPCTTRQLAQAFGLHVAEASKYIGRLLRTRRIRAERYGQTVYYAAMPPARGGGLEEGGCS